MAPKKPTTPTNGELMSIMKSVKGMVLNQGKILKDHNKRLSDLEGRDHDEEIAKIAAKNAVDEYKKSLPVTETGGEKKLTSDLVKIIIQLIGVIGAIIALSQLLIQVGGK